MFKFFNIYQFAYTYKGKTIVSFNDVYILYHYYYYLLCSVLEFINIVRILLMPMMKFIEIVYFL